MPEDAPDFFACQSDPEVFRYNRRSEETSLESATHTLNILFQRHHERTMLSWAIVLKENQRFIGRFQMEEWSDEDHRAAVGYLLGKQYWGRGYATTAVLVAFLVRPKQSATRTSGEAADLPAATEVLATQDVVEEEVTLRRG